MFPPRHCSAERTRNRHRTRRVWACEWLSWASPSLTSRSWAGWEPVQALQAEAAPLLAVQAEERAQLIPRLLFLVRPLEPWPVEPVWARVAEAWATESLQASPVAPRHSRLAQLPAQVRRLAKTMLLEMELARMRQAARRRQRFPEY